MTRTEVFSLPRRDGQRFCILHQPADAVAARGAVLFVHPFAEEMNLSRRVTARHSHALAAAGWVVLRVDLLGCGDSSGDFGEATWQGWIDDVLDAGTWLQRRAGYCPTLWGLRAGCLLAAEAVLRMPRPADLLFWQPITSGKQFLQQLLRIKTAQHLIAKKKDRVRTHELHKQWSEGRSIEIAGYSVSPALALGMQAAEIELPTSATRVACFEISSSGTGELSPAYQKAVQKWQMHGHSVTAKAINGPAIWQNAEAEECAPLTESTIEVLSGWREAA